MTDRKRDPLPEGYQFGDARRVVLTALRVERARVDGRADRPSLSGGDREPDDFDMGGGVPSWSVEDGRLVRLNPPKHWNVIEGEHFASDAERPPVVEGYVVNRDLGDEA